MTNPISLFVATVKRVYASRLMVEIEAADFRGSHAEKVPPLPQGQRLMADINRYYVSEGTPLFETIDPAHSYVAGDQVALMRLDMINPQTREPLVNWLVIGRWRAL